jgi:2-keto-4-pentenoate hydratase
MEVLNGQSIPAANIMNPKVETEIAFVLNKSLDFENITIVDIIGAIDFALPAIEIVGSRINNWDIKITDTIADNASASHYVLGSSPKKITDFDNVNCQMKMTINKQEVSSGSGADCLGSPLNATLWLANMMYRMGKPLRKGELVLSGALGKFADVKKGDLVEASISGLGTVSVSFT